MTKGIFLLERLGAIAFVGFLCAALGFVLGLQLVGLGWNRKCSNGEPHAYGKWELNSGSYAAGSAVLQRRTCSNCGWTEWK